ncbi:hypothetical protein RB200_33670 [Streptomyces sp. PmtG]
MRTNDGSGWRRGVAPIHDPALGVARVGRQGLDVAGEVEEFVDAGAAPGRVLLYDADAGSAQVAEEQPPGPAQALALTVAGLPVVGGAQQDAQGVLAAVGRGPADVAGLDDVLAPDVAPPPRGARLEPQGAVGESGGAGRRAQGVGELPPLARRAGVDRHLGGLSAARGAGARRGGEDVLGALEVVLEQHRRHPQGQRRGRAPGARHGKGQVDAAVPPPGVAHDVASLHGEPHPLAHLAPGEPPGAAERHEPAVALHEHADVTALRDGHRHPPARVGVRALDAGRPHPHRRQVLEVGGPVHDLVRRVVAGREPPVHGQVEAVEVAGAQSAAARVVVDVGQEHGPLGRLKGRARARPPPAQGRAAPPRSRRTPPRRTRRAWSCGAPSASAAARRPGRPRFRTRPARTRPSRAPSVARHRAEAGSRPWTHSTLPARPARRVVRPSDVALHPSAQPAKDRLPPRAGGRPHRTARCAPVRARGAGTGPSTGRTPRSAGTRAARRASGAARPR